MKMLTEQRNYLADFFKLLKKEFLYFYDKYKVVFWVGIIVAVATYGYEICNYTLSIDERPLLNATNRYATAWFAENRFSIGIFKLLFMRIRMFPPFFASFLSVTFWFISGIFWCINILNLSKTKAPSKMSLFAFIGVYLTVPFIITEFIVFNTYNIEISFGMILAALTVRVSNEFWDTKRSVFLILNIVLLVFTLGFYQSFLTVYILGICFSLLIKAINSQDVLIVKKEVVRAFFEIVTCGISLIIYFVLARVLCIAFFPNGSAPYLEFFSNTWSLNGFYSTLVAFKNSFLKPTDTGSIYFVFALIAFLMFACLVLLTTKKGLKLWITVVLIGCCVSPFLLWLLLMSPWGVPMRTMQAVVLFMALAWFLLFSQIEKINLLKLIKVLCSIIVVIVVFSQSQLTSRIFYSNHLSYERDKALATDILNRIEAETGVSKYHSGKPIAFVGAFYFPPDDFLLKGAVNGASFWNYYNSASTIYAIINELGVTRDIIGSLDLIEDTTKYKTLLEPWPSANSILEEEDRIIVRIG